VSDQSYAFAHLEDECQRVSYTVFEDLRQLRDHPIVSDSRSRDLAFFDLINRKALHENGDPPAIISALAANRFPSVLIKDPGLLVTDDLAATIGRAQTLLSFYKNTEDTFPPPLWLRLLPTCLHIAGTLVRGANSPKLRFLSLALEDPIPERRRIAPYDVFVNVNSHLPRDRFDTVTRAANRVSRSLNRSLFGSYYSDGRNPVPPYVWWGIRFRTNGALPNVSQPRYWLDVRVATAPSNDFSRLTLTADDTLTADISFPTLLGRFDADSAQDAIEPTLRAWLFDGVPPDVRGSIPLTAPSDQLFAYVALNSTNFPSGRYPQQGMDCLICPGAFWSVDTLVWGTGMTISYGFEGEVPTEAANRILSLTQKLMTAPTIYAQLQKVSERATAVGIDTILHQIPQDLQNVNTSASLHAVTVRQNIEYFGKYVPKDRLQEFRQLFQPFELPHNFLFALMVAQAASLERVNEMPTDLREALNGPWDTSHALVLVDKLIRPWVLGRVDEALSSEKDKAKIFKTAFPSVRVLEPITLQHPEGLLLALVFALRNAFQHAFLHAIRAPQSGGPAVTIARGEEDGDEYILIRNTGAQPQADSARAAQYGWYRDVALLERYKKSRWRPRCQDARTRQYSVWSAADLMWETRLDYRVDNSHVEGVSPS